MSAFRKINRNPSKKDLLVLAAVFLVGFGALALHQRFVKHHELASEIFAILAVGLAALSLVPRVGRVVYVVWMAIGVTIGMFTQPIFLFVVFALCFVPVSAIFRLMGRNAMRRDLNRARSTYWEDYEESDEKRTYFKQY